jgi:hypothetical protein
MGMKPPNPPPSRWNRHWFITVHFIIIRFLPFGDFIKNKIRGDMFLQNGYVSRSSVIMPLMFIIESTPTF